MRYSRCGERAEIRPDPGHPPPSRDWPLQAGLREERFPSFLAASNAPLPRAIVNGMEGLTRVRSLRRERGLTQQELGRRCGLSRSFLSQVETGNRVPSLSSLTRISAALGIMPVDVLIRPEQETSER